MNSLVSTTRRNNHFLSYKSEHTTMAIGLQVLQRLKSWTQLMGMLGNDTLIINGHRTNLEETKHIYIFLVPIKLNTKNILFQ